MTNNNDMPKTIIRESWTERQAKYSLAKLDEKAEVDYSRPRPAPRTRNTSVRHRAIH